MDARCNCRESLGPLVEVGVVGPDQRRVGNTLYQVILGVSDVQPGSRPPGEVGGDLCGDFASLEPSVASSSLSSHMTLSCGHLSAPFMNAAFSVSSGWKWSVRKVWAPADRGESHL